MTDSGSRGPRWWIRTASAPAVSRLLGRVIRLPLPRPLAQSAIGAYAALFRVDASEAEQPLGRYATLDGFFTRRLKPGARPIDPDPEAAVWPADGAVIAAGPMAEDAAGQRLEVKGTPYSLQALLGDPQGAASLARGGYLVIHLSPRDYHRLHWPMDLDVARIRHIPGRRYPVNRLGLESGAAVFLENERVVIDATPGPGRRLFIVLVAAFGVGGISLAFDIPPGGSEDGAFPAERTYAEPFRARKGEELGAFHLGSSVVLCWSEGLLEPKQPLPDRAFVGRSFGRIGPTPKETL